MTATLPVRSMPIRAAIPALPESCPRRRCYACSRDIVTGFGQEGAGSRDDCGGRADFGGGGAGRRLGPVWGPVRDRRRRARDPAAGARLWAAPADGAGDGPRHGRAECAVWALGLSPAGWGLSWGQRV